MKIINISNEGTCIVMQSEYHYWRIIKRDNLFFLHHKHKEEHPYHVQRSKPFNSLRSVYNYIESHDRYVSSKLITP